MSATSVSLSFSCANLSGNAKLDIVTRLVKDLALDLQNKLNLAPHERDAHLETLKIYGRDPTNAEPIFTEEGIRTLAGHAFNSSSLTTSRNALRCLANALLLRAETRQIFVNLGFEEKVCNKLRNDSSDDEFLVSRIIFLTTYGTNLDIGKLIDQHSLGSIICRNVARYAKNLNREKPSDPMEDMALMETLKLIFNITHFCSDRRGAFSPAMKDMLALLMQPISTTGPLGPPHGSLVNAIMNLDFEDNLTYFFPNGSPHLYVDRLIEILEMSVSIYKDQELEQNVSPLITLIRKLYEIAPQDARKYLQCILLPTPEDRKEILGRGATLSSKLLRLSTNPMTPQLRESISALQFELSEKDAQTFINNVGYGFASGFLFQHKVPMPENALEARSTNGVDLKVNPITGQLLQNEESIEVKDITDEEKEREAEKLFVLFERLKKTGIMKVKNPVETAIDSGRFEDLSNDSD